MSDECKTGLNCNCKSCKQIANCYICKTCGSTYKLDSEPIKNALGDDELLYVCSNGNCEEKENKQSRFNLEMPYELMELLYLSDYSTTDDDSSNVTIEIVSDDATSESLEL